MRNSYPYVRHQTWRSQYSFCSHKLLHAWVSRHYSFILHWASSVENWRVLQAKFQSSKSYRRTFPFDLPIFSWRQPTFTNLGALVHCNPGSFGFREPGIQLSIRLDTTTLPLFDDAWNSRHKLDKKRCPRREIPGNKSCKRFWVHARNCELYVSLDFMTIISSN